jgi:hypothetical protein
MTDFLASLSDDDFAAWWDVRIEEAAQDSDEAKVEKLMLAYGEAFAERYPA